MALSTEPLTSEIARACHNDIKEMIRIEDRYRRLISDKGVYKTQKFHFEQKSDDQRQCEVCKTTLYLSALTCPCNEKYVCVHHYDELCDCPMSKKELLYRHTIADLNKILEGLNKGSNPATAWEKAVKELHNKSEGKKVSLDELKRLQKEAIDKNFKKSPLYEELAEAIANAEKIIILINYFKTKDDKDLKKFTLEDVDLLAGEIDNLWCTLDGSYVIKSIRERGKKLEAKIDKIVKAPLDELNDEILQNILENVISIQQ